MPNGINYELDFEKRMGEMGDRQLIEFIARQTLEITGKCRIYDKSIALLENGDRRTASIMGSITGTIASIIVSVLSYFIGVNRG